jgi:hypothetical protein
LKTKFDGELSDLIEMGNGVSMAAAEQLFHYFKHCPVFRWQDCNNDCEDRANALCMLLEKWHIPNCKGWVFGGMFLKRGMGSLTNNWNYHVAATIPVNIDGIMHFYVLDPAMLASIQPLAVWADAVTDQPDSYYMVKQSRYYIFPPANICKDNWFERDRRNFKWTMQGLAGINGVSKTGKAQLVFNKAKVQQAEKSFKQLLTHPPTL